MQNEAESAFGGEFDWQELTEKRACRICAHFNDYGLIDEEHWDEIITFLADNLANLIKAFKAPLDVIMKSE